MAENDIYNNEKKYNKFVNNVKSLLIPPKAEDKRRKYWIKNKSNLKYFEELFKKFEARDLSYIRRLRLLRTFLIAGHIFDKDFSEVTREDIDKLMAFGHSVNHSTKSKQDFAIDIKHIWKQLFPERDGKGRIDDTIIPYAVRHLSGKVDVSKQKLRGDKFSLDEFERLVQAFSNDTRMQALLTISLESLGRPQELLGRKIKDVEVFDNYAKIYISEHGKEGTGILRVIDSFFYLQQWLNKHPLRKNKEAYLFCNVGNVNKYKQMTPYAANKMIHFYCKKIGIDKPITLYSLKRNGVTMMRLAGASDLDIQHTARWSSTKQLKTYDMSSQEESLKVELIKRGLIPADKKHKDLTPSSKKCIFCGTINGMAESFCSNCKRPLDRETIQKEAENKDSKIEKLEKQMAVLLSRFENLENIDKAIAIKKTKK